MMRTPQLCPARCRARYVGLCLAWGALVFAGPACAEAGSPADSPAGRWQGEIDFGGQTLTLAVGLRGEADALTGVMDIQGMKGQPLHALRFDSPDIYFEFRHSTGTAAFEGTVSGEEMSGEFERGGATGTFSLRKIVPDDIGPAMLAQMESEHIPGAAAAIVRGGKVVWTGAWGYAEVEAERPRPATPDSVFQLASVSKTITATALVMLQAQGKFSLDDDINTHLPFSVRNPNAPDAPITFGQLLRHRSSIRDDMAYYGPLWGEAQGDWPTPLSEFLPSYLVEGGELYNAAENFFDYGPGGDFAYCNTCYALIGYLAERISGEPFQQYTRRVLFEPLGMKGAAWFHRDADPSRLVKQYRHDAEAGFVAYDVIGYPDWPAGTLRMSVKELAAFLAAYTSALAGDEQGVIPPEVAQTMSPGHQVLGSYTWFISSMDSTADVLYSHGGGDLGTRTEMAFNPASGEGIVVLTNGEGDVVSLAAIVYEALPTLGW